MVQTRTVCTGKVSIMFLFRHGLRGLMTWSLISVEACGSFTVLFVESVMYRLAALYQYLIC